MRAWLLGLVSCLASTSAGAAVTISFNGIANGHDVSGIVRYDDNQPINIYSTGTDSRVGFYYPQTADYRLTFVTDGYFVNDGYVGIVADAFPGNSANYGDALNFQLTRGASGRESYAFTIQYDTATALTDTRLPANPPQGPATFSYSYAGRGYTIPVSWTAQAGLVPEPASWALIIGGIGLIGGTLRRRTTAAAVRFA